MTQPNKTPLSALLFLSAMVLLCLLFETVLWQLSDWQATPLGLKVFILVCFGFLIISVSYMVVCTLTALFFPLKPLKQAQLKSIPATAILYIIKNENELEKFIIPSLHNALIDPNVHFWLLSNSNKASYLKKEAQLMAQLKQKFGADCIHHYQNNEQLNPKGRKHLCISQWLKQYASVYPYSLVCDADTTLPPNCVEQFVATAEHPDNQHYAAFQGLVEIASSPTLYVKNFLKTAKICQKVYMAAAFRAFKTAPLFGHGFLVRNAVFQKVEAPEDALSHDIFDAVAIHSLGHTIAFCPHIKTQEEYPPNYIEYLRREARWIMGTLQSWRLLFQPKLSLGARFFVFFPLYSYLTQPFFLAWLVISFVVQFNTTAQALTLHQYIAVAPLVQDCSVALAPSFGLVLGSVLGHRFLLVGSFKEALVVFYEIVFSTLLVLNNIIYTSLAVLLSPFKKSRWIVMPKGQAHAITAGETFKTLWPSLVLGMIALILGLMYVPYWLAWSLPFVISFLIAIPLTWYSSQPLSKKKSSLKI